MCDEGCYRLIEAIVNCAIADLKSSSLKFLQNKETEKSEKLLKDCMMFFQSDYFSSLVNINPMIILAEVRKDVCREFRNQRKA